jgi:hypothetical protein
MTLPAEVKVESGWPGQARPSTRPEMCTTQLETALSTESRTSASPWSKLSPGSMNELDYFAPADFATLNADDLDFGSAGPTLLLGTSLIIQGGKEGTVFLLNTNSLGHETAGNVQVRCSRL